MIPLIAQIGLEGARYIWERWKSGAEPTAADWDTLAAMGQQTPEDMVLRAARLAAIPENDPRVKELLALVRIRP